jgi:ADP-ribose pyrophosphatase YjhB (NUDIX family)
MHKVFINDKPLIFQDIYGEINNTGELLVWSDSEYSMLNVIEQMETKNNPGIIYLCSNPDVAWNLFVSRYILMEAAGGLVLNDLNEFLVIFRKGKWDLPKGKLDYNESPESAAVREVKEECGLKNVELNKFLTKTFHIYSEKHKWILKKTHWYIMNSTDLDLKPQKDEKIEKAKWMSKEKVLQKVYSNTYNAVKNVFETFFNLKDF